MRSRMTTDLGCWVRAPVRWPTPILRPNLMKTSASEAIFCTSADSSGGGGSDVRTGLPSVRADRHCPPGRLFGRPRGGRRGRHGSARRNLFHLLDLDGLHRDLGFRFVVELARSLVGGGRRGKGGAGGPRLRGGCDGGRGRRARLEPLLALTSPGCSSRMRR